MKPIYSRAIAVPIITILLLFVENIRARTRVRIILALALRAHVCYTVFMEITLNDVKLYYEVTGKGSPVILLHGNGESHKIFDVLINRLAATYSCYAIDSRCHGKSGNAPLTYDNMAGDVSAFIDELQLEKPTIIGFSDGGIVALILGVKYGDKVGKLFAMGPNVSPDGNKKWFVNTVKFLYAFTRNAKYKLMLEEPNITAEELQSIKNPAVILAGEKDIIRTEHIRYIAQNVPCSVCEILSGESHGSYVVHSPKLYGIIEKYL